MYLVDTNIVLEVLLQQEKKEKCKKFLSDFAGEICISDYSVFSIGNILFYRNKITEFVTGFKELRGKLFLKSLIEYRLESVVKLHLQFNLDFEFISISDCERIRFNTRDT
jgi:hypothetical protein